MSQTAFAFRDDAYLREIEAEVLDVNECGGLVLDRTIFYATSGGQPGDSGSFDWSGGSCAIATAIHPDGDKSNIIHVPDEAALRPEPGTRVKALIDWDRRHRLMRMHTALHLLTVVLPYPITGAAVAADKGRIDFDMPELPGDKEDLQTQLNAIVEADHPVTAEWITDAELEANPGLVKSLHVRPPRGQGQVRLVRIGDKKNPVDVQPCGGTHVRSTAEIGHLLIGKIEKKGRENRRVTLRFAEDAT